MKFLSAHGDGWLSLLIGLGSRSLSPPPSRIYLINSSNERSLSLRSAAWVDRSGNLGSFVRSSVFGCSRVPWGFVWEEVISKFLLEIWFGIFGGRFWCDSWTLLWLRRVTAGCSNRASAQLDCTRLWNDSGYAASPCCDSWQLLCVMMILRFGVWVSFWQLSLA